MSALETLEAARRAWERSQPQLIFELDELDQDQPLPPLPPGAPGRKDYGEVRAAADTPFEKETP